MTAKKKKSVWVITVASESGDDFGAHLFDYKPSDDDLESFLRELSPCDWEGADEDGPGFRGSCLHVEGPFEQDIASRKR